MLGDAEHVEGRSGGPDDEVSFVAQGEFEEIGMFAVYNGEKDGIVGGGFAGLIGAVAKDETEGIGGLVPCSVLFVHVGVVYGNVTDAGEFERVSEVGSCEASSEDFGEGSTSLRLTGIGNIVV